MPADGRVPGSGSGPASFGRGIRGFVILASAVLQLGSLHGFLIVLRFMRLRRSSLSMVLLVAYWLTLAGIVVFAVLAS